MAFHDTCLSCGHMQDHGPPPEPRCHKAYCVVWDLGLLF